jgi:polygalacturonase
MWSSRTRFALVTIPSHSQLFNVEGLVISDLTLLDSPLFNIQVRGNNIHIFNMRIIANGSVCHGYSSAPNTDGFVLTLCSRP